ncbi:DHHC palmitoyltransferase-domain-containing protein [Amylostereum chailletii]|nr:DHHC palmitoyltransferase-domain-containing protein [Amylostereum chailletii]
MASQHSSQHSLPYSASTPTPNFNRPSQLPSTLSSVGLSTKFDSAPNRLRTASTSNHSSHARTGSGVSSASRPRHTLSTVVDPQSPSRKSFASTSTKFGGSATHAGGILPSASFFRPSKPNNNLSYIDTSRRSSIVSSHDIPPSPREGTGNPSFPLQPIPHDLSYDSDASGEVMTIGGPQSVAATDEAARQLPLKNTTYSREPLLPVPPMSGPSFEQSGRGPTDWSSKPSTGGTRVREGLERFKRGISLESVRRSLSAPNSQQNSPMIGEPRINGLNVTSPSNGRGTFEPKTFDEYKTSAMPMHDMASAAWVPYPPTNMVHPLAGVPKRNAENTRSLRNYEFIPSKNRWFVQGRILVGGDTPWAFIGSLVLLLGISGVWFGTTCVWWWHNKSPAVAAVGIYMTLLCISLFFTTAFRDPGILPRNLDLNPPYPPTSPSDGAPRIPYPRDLSLRSGTVRVKYCTTCQTYRPPRSSHCKMCDNCVDGCDHHCQWVNNCVGRRNYTYFFALITMCTLTLVLVIITSALHLWFLTHDDHDSFREALNKGVGSAVAFSLSILLIWPVAALFSYHVRLLFLNMTTIEQIRSQAHKSLGNGPLPPNPFAHSNWRGNVADVLCRPAGLSWVEPHAIVMEDKRAINPGFAMDEYQTGYDVDVERRGDSGDS